MLRTFVLLALLAAPSSSQESFVNWESPHVHPLELTPDGSFLLCVNTPDNRLEVFEVAGATVTHAFDVAVGLDPVSVRARSATEVWVVNHISDSVSVVDLVSGNVVATIVTDDEPCDVVFAGTPERAFVTCSQESRVLVYDPANLSGPAPVLATLAIEGEEPRALAASADGSKVYVALFESGNGTTVLAGGKNAPFSFPPNVVNDPAGPWGGVNPPPNDGASFTPPQNAQNPAPPRVSLIVKRNASAQWIDDNGGDWTDMVSGPNAAASGRPIGWDLLDHDIAIIDAQTFAISYASRELNIVMALDVHPVNGDVTVVGTDATNEIRYEPNLTGTFLRVEYARVSALGAAGSAADLNPHLDYTTSSVSQSLRDQSLGDPRGIAWSADGARAWVTGMGSNNLVVIDSSGVRTGQAPTIEVGEGPTGVVVHDAEDRVYVLNKFESSLSIVDATTELETARIAFHDPSPVAIKAGRRRLYDTHESSGLGQIACGSCHVDARTDRLAWDLGDPAGSMKTFNQNCPDGTCEDWHPMKGPMLTQTLQDIIGKEPLHWRGDKDGLEEFNPAFLGLQGDDQSLTAQAMQEFEDFLATITIPPNPFRNMDNSLPQNVPLPGQLTSGLFSPGGQPMPDGDAQNGLVLYRPPNMLDGIACVSCHTLPLGMGTDMTLSANLQSFEETPEGPNGERHHAIVGTDGSTNRSIKTPQLRTLYDRVGMNLWQTTNTTGFGYFHDGSFDSLSRFISVSFEPHLSNDQQVADLVAFMLSFSGSDLPAGDANDVLEPPGTSSRDTHAAVGMQTTLVDSANPAPGQLALIGDMLALADAGRVGVVVKGSQAGLARGYVYDGAGNYQADREVESLAAAALAGLAATGSELTWTVVPFGSELRIGVDRDEDGFFDRDELDHGTDPADAEDFPRPGAPYCFGDGGDQTGCTSCPCANDALAGSGGGCLNSAGGSARLMSFGAANETLRFELREGNASTFGVLVSGDNALPANVASPCFGLDSGVTSFALDGLRCAGGAIQRHGARPTNALGEIGVTGPGWGPPNGPPGGIAAQGGFGTGQTRRFQVFYREESALVCMTGSNTSNGVSVTFTN